MSLIRFHHYPNDMGQQPLGNWVRHSDIASIVEENAFLRKVLEPFADMDRDCGDLSELVLQRGIKSEATFLFNRDFRNARKAICDKEELKVIEADEEEERHRNGQFGVGA